MLGPCGGLGWAGGHGPQAPLTFPLLLLLRGWLGDDGWLLREGWAHQPIGGRVGGCREGGDMGMSPRTLLGPPSTPPHPQSCLVPPALPHALCPPRGTDLCSAASQHRPAAGGPRGRPGSVLGETSGQSVTGWGCGHRDMPGPGVGASGTWVGVDTVGVKGIGGGLPCRLRGHWAVAIDAQRGRDGRDRCGSDGGRRAGTCGGRGARVISATMPPGLSTPTGPAGVGPGARLAAPPKGTTE